jgi:hypothetical protein
VITAERWVRGIFDSAVRRNPLARRMLWVREFRLAYRGYLFDIPVEFEAIVAVG